MFCPYCGDTELIESLYYICAKCKIAMTGLELAIAIRGKEDRELLERLSGKSIVESDIEL